MTPAQFKHTYYPAIELACAASGLNPLFVAAQAALESGWGDRAIGHNLFGITADSRWTGPRRRVRTTEYFSDAHEGARFSRVYAITPTTDGRYRYDVERDFCDYASVEQCLEDHARLLAAKRYAAAWPYRDDVRRFAYEIARAGYCTADPAEYANLLGRIARMIERA